MAENILTKIIEHKRIEVRKQQQGVCLEELQEQIQGLARPRNFFKAVTKPPTRRINLIAEIKRSSPSAGLICRDFDPIAIAKQYHQAGADAISVLTDEKFFGGSLHYIKQVKEIVPIPVGVITPPRKESALGILLWENSCMIKDTRPIITGNGISMAKNCPTTPTGSGRIRNMRWRCIVNFGESVSSRSVTG